MLYLKLYLLLINIVSFIVFFVDKRKSIKNKWRIKENTLHLFSFIGGVYGSIAAMLLFKHKTRKPKFCIITAIALGINIFIIYELVILLSYLI